MLSGNSIETTVELKRGQLSSKTVLRYFHKFLDKLILPPKPTTPYAIYLLIDAIYFKGIGCLLVYKNKRKIIYWNFVKYETFNNYKQDLITITNSGYIICGVTSDWHGSIVGAIKYLFPSIPHQRCLVHLKRSAKTYLTQNPKIEAGKDLLRILKLVTKVTTKQESIVWLNWINIWYQNYGYFLNEKTKGFNPKTGKYSWWYTHKNIRRVYNSVTKSKDNLFLYLDNSNIPSNTNGIEGEFSHLKEKVNTHRGLSKRRKVSLMFWYLHLLNFRR